MAEALRGCAVVAPAIALLNARNIHCELFRILSCCSYCTSRDGASRRVAPNGTLQLWLERIVAAVLRWNLIPQLRAPGACYTIGV